MKWFARFAVTVFVLFVAMTMIRLGQPRAQGNPDDEKPKNLKVLPKDMSHREVVQIMRGYSIALGVRCDACHAQKEGSDELAFDLDKKPEKATARKMMKMVDAINDQVAKMELKDPPKVACVTCHHGVREPQTLTALVMKTTHDKGADAAITQYRQLRDQYYGSAAYNFQPQSLNEAALQLSDADKNYDAALKLLALNLEFSAKDANTYVTMARVQIAKGDKAGAQASLKSALDIDPNNRGAKMLMQQVQ